MRGTLRTALALLCLALPGFAAPALAAPLVLLDPGHGGSDPGVVEDGFRESDFCLALAKRVVPLLKRRGVDARLTRDSDVDLSVSARTALADRLRPLALVSLHANAAFQDSARGPRVFVPAPSSPDLGEAPLWEQAAGLHAAASRTLGLCLAGALGLRGPRAVQTLKLALFRGLDVPGCLVEIEYATNPQGLAALKDDARAEAWAGELAEGIAAYVLPKGPAPAPGPSPSEAAHAQP